MMNWLKLIIHLTFHMIAVAAFASAGWAGEQPVLHAATAEGEYLLGAGDSIEVQVWNEEDLSRTLRIRLDGRISLPLIGEIEAAGASLRELAAQIEERYNQVLAEPSVTVILSQSNYRYYVLGQVKEPGEFALDAHLTVLQALARSGGFLEWAKTSEIALIRRRGTSKQVLKVDYDNLIKKGDLSQDLPLAPGDTIVVP